MSAMEFNITGAKAVEDILKQLPQKYAKKPMVSTFRKGAREFTKVLRRNTPIETGETRKSIKVKALRGIGITAGFSAAGGKMPGYFKALWSNYGTLDNRDSAHSFKKSRKQISSNWSGGIRATGFVEQSWQQTKQQVQQKIENELKNETLKFLNKHKVN